MPAPSDGDHATPKVLGIGARDRHDETAREGWSAVIAVGGVVEIPQRRGTAAVMTAGALVLLAIEVGCLALVGASDALAVRRYGPPLLLVTLVTAVLFVPVPLHRLLTGGPRLRVDAAGLSYGRFSCDWLQVAGLHRANVQNVEVRGRGRRFPLDNLVVSTLMRVLTARGSWLAASLTVPADVLVPWLTEVRRRHRPPRARVRPS